MEKNEKNKKEEDSKEELTIEDIPGVGEATAEKLRENNYTDVMAI